MSILVCIVWVQFICIVNFLFPDRNKIRWPKGFIALGISVNRQRFCWSKSINLESKILEKVPEILKVGTCVNIATTKFELDDSNTLQSFRRAQQEIIFMTFPCQVAFGLHPQPSGARQRGWLPGFR